MGDCMTKKRIAILIISGILLVSFVVLTIVSQKVYIALLPEVTTHTLRTSTSKDGVNERWLPRECIRKNSRGEDAVYVVREREGRFRKEFYAEEVAVDVKDTRDDGYVLVLAMVLGHMDPIIIKSNLPVSDQEAVKWTNKAEYDREPIR